MKHVKVNILIFCLSILSSMNMSYAKIQIEDHQNIKTPNQNISDPENVLMDNKEFIRLSCEQEKDQMYLETATEQELLELKTIMPEKEYTLVVFMAANNDLHRFGLKNIIQMEAVGSNENINIIVQLHTPGSSNPTKRYLIKKGKRLLIQADGPAPTQKLDSGDPQTLIDCVEWAMKYYPAKNLILNFWNHGSGCWDPGVSKTINTCDLFHVNPETNMLEVDRSVEYIEHIKEQNYEEQTESISHQDAETLEYDKRGICFDETYRSYMTNQDIKYALSEIHHKILGGKKIAAVWFDACLMSMIEIANICKDHADFLIASEDVEYASGSNYQLVLNPFIQRSPSPREFACHVVESFRKAYQHITRDFTQSAIDLSQIDSIEKNINLVAQQLLTAMQYQKNTSVTKMIQQCKSRLLCTCFEEPSFIDLRHFYINLQANLRQMDLTDTIKEIAIKTRLEILLEHGVNAINNAVIANATGGSLPHACGLSIYFPERSMFNSYPHCNFARSNNWSTLLKEYLQQIK